MPLTGNMRDTMPYGIQQHAQDAVIPVCRMFGTKEFLIELLRMFVG
jgi:hypothetical protein